MVPLFTHTSDCRSLGSSLAGPCVTVHEMRHISGRCHHTTMTGGGYWLSLCALKVKFGASHQGESSLMAAPLGKGVIAVNESKGGSDTNWSPVLWPLWLFGYFHVTALDDFSKAGGIQVAGSVISLFFMHPELQPASLRKPLFPCLAFSYFLVIISITISPGAVQAAVWKPVWRKCWARDPTE